MADLKRKKKRGRSKLFRSCFRSFAADERPFLYDKSDGRNTRNGRLGKPVLIAASGCEGEDVVPDVKTVDDAVIGSGGGGCSPERSSHGRGVTRLLKSVLFDSLMVKKICSSSKSSIVSDTGESCSSTEKTGKQSNDSNAYGLESTDMEDSSSRRSNLFSSSSRTTSSSNSSSSSSSTNSTSQWLSEPKTSPPLDTADPNFSSNSSSLQKPNVINPTSQSNSDQKSSFQSDSISLPLAKSNSLPQSSTGLSQSTNAISSNKIKSIGNNWNIRWCLFFLLSLIVLVVYGRIYAILCTSIWLYLVPCGRVKSVSNAGRVMDTESEQYKKRVIMAGLLDRTRNPLR